MQSGFHKMRCGLALSLACAVLSGCTPEDEALLGTAMASAVETAVEDTKHQAATEVAHLSETAVAGGENLVATLAAGGSQAAGTAIAQVQTSMPRLGNHSPALPGARCTALADGVQSCDADEYVAIVADLSRPWVGLHAITANNWTDPERFSAQTVQDMIPAWQETLGCSIVAGINGGYFGPGHHNSEGWTVVNGQARRDMRAKVQIDPSYTPQHWPALVIDDRGIARIGRYLWRDTYAWAAVTAGPIFIEAGQVLPMNVCKQQMLPERYCTETYNQSVAAVSRDGRTVYLLVAPKQNLQTVAQWLGPAGAGVWTAIKLDGGSSTQLVYRTGDAWRRVIPPGSGRAVSDAIVICAH